MCSGAMRALVCLEYKARGHSLQCRAHVPGRVALKVPSREYQLGEGKIMNAGQLQSIVVSCPQQLLGQFWQAVLPQGIYEDCAALLQ